MYEPIAAAGHDEPGADSSDLPTVVALADALAGREVSATELTEDSLRRIEATEDTLNAFRHVRAEEARAEAADADRRLAAGERGPLLGVPIAVKDDMDVAGLPTAFGCRGSFPVKAVDGEVVRRLRDAGAIIVGKTNTPEVGLYPLTEGAAFGSTRNPWNLERTPGGSSGGSAAAVAAGIVPAALGSDGAGSVRIPAAWTGLVGIKPHRGRISTWPQTGAFNGIVCYGPLTRTVADAARLLDVVCGNHPQDIYRAAAPPRPFSEAVARGPGRLRIAVSLRAAFCAAPVRLDPEIAAAIRRIGDVLTGLGHDVFEADPAYGLIGLPFLSRSLSGVAQWAEDAPDRSALDPRTVSTAQVGHTVARRFLGTARALDTVFRRRVGRIFARADVVLTPTTARRPLPIGSIDGLGGWATDQLVASSCPYAWPWNHLGWPALSVPARPHADGLPIGAQLLGRPRDEATLIALASQLEGVERWPERTPPHRA